MLAIVCYINCDAYNSFEFIDLSRSIAGSAPVAAEYRASKPDVGL